MEASETAVNCELCSVKGNSCVTGKFCFSIVLLAGFSTGVLLLGEHCYS